GWFGWYMDIRKICPTAVNGVLSRVSRTQPVPSMAACFAGSARTAKMTSAGALMTVVALTQSSDTWLTPHEVSLSPVLKFAKSGTSRWRRHRTDRDSRERGRSMAASAPAQNAEADSDK